MAPKRKAEATTANKLLPHSKQAIKDEDEIFVPSRNKSMLNKVQAGRLVAKATSDVTASSSWQRKVTDGSDMDIPLLESNDEGYQGELDADTYQKTTHLKVKKAGAERKPIIPTVPETPGDPKHPWTFIDIDSNEQNIGAYVGFSDVMHLRTFVVSWPVVKAYLDFNPIAPNMNKISAFQLLYREESSIKKSQGNITYQKTDNEDLTKDEKDHYLAGILLQMEQSIGMMGWYKKYSYDFNTLVQGEQVFPMLAIANIFGPGSPDKAYPLVQMPNLGPHPGEHRLESINRCWALPQAQKSPQAVIKRQTPAKAQAQKTPRAQPQALNKPKARCTPPTPDKLPHVLAAATIAASALPPLSIPILWDRKYNFCGKADLDKALSQADLLDIPNSDHIILKDTGLDSSLESFQDHIRKLYNCHKLLMDIRALKLSYESPEWGGTELSVNIGQQTWSDTKSIFQDPVNSNFKLRVVFEAVDTPAA